MNFTDNPFEIMMKQPPRAYRPEVKKAPPDTLCRNCSYWQGAACVGTCYKDLMEFATSGQFGPKLAREQSHG